MIDDFRPQQQATQQPTSVPQQSTMADTSAAPVAAQVKKKSKAPVVILIVLLLLALAAGAGVYYWQHQKVQDLNSSVTSLNGQVSSLNSQLAAASSASKSNTATQTTTPTLTTDEQVIAALTNYCNANVDATSKQPLVLTVGKAGTAQKQVLYSSDKLFAYVNAACTKSAAEATGSYTAFYLKKVNGSWVYLFRSQETPSAELKAQYNLPAEYN